VTLAQLIRRKRAQLALSQQELADKSGVSKNLISKIEVERGSNITLATLLGLAKAMRVTPQVVLYAAMEGMKVERGLDVSLWMKGETDG
jgi:transcriptional regulator with XRE-family HTH domain